jgi:hypothetical protein
MSHFSQFSVAGPSSQILSDAPDLASLYSDDQSLIGGNLDSQRTTTSTPGFEFISPISAPLSLERGGPPSEKFWVIRSDMNKDDFILWWVQTQADNNNNKLPFLRAFSNVRDYACSTYHLWVAGFHS